MSYHVEVVSTLDALDALQECWQALYAAVPENTGFFASYQYLRVYLNFHRPVGWVVVAVFNTNKDQLLGVFPLSIFNIQDGSTVYRACKPLGGAYAPYFDFAVQSHFRRDVLSILLYDVLRGHFKCDLAFLGPLHDSSPLCLALLEDINSQELKIVRNPNSLSQIETRGQYFEDYFRQRKSLTLPNARYQERRLRKMGTVEIRLADHGEDFTERVVELCQRNEAQFAETNYYRHHANWHAYMAQLVTHLAPQGLAEFSTLRLNDQVIASALSFIHPGRHYFYLTAYDPVFANHSPSKILMSRLIERTFAEKRVFCFGAALYPYKLDWLQSVGDIRTPIVFFSPESRRALDERLVAGKLSAFLG